MISIQLLRGYMPIYEEEDVIAIYKDGQVVYDRHPWPRDIKEKDVIIERMDDYKMMFCNICRRQI
jgi:hypothetical protein